MTIAGRRIPGRLEGEDDTPVTATRQVAATRQGTVAAHRFSGLHLTAEVHETRGGDHLWLRDTHEITKGLLLGLSRTAEAAGASGVGHLGRLHGTPWAVAFGSGPAPDAVRFCSADLRFRRELTVQPVALGSYWVAAAEGVFAVAELGDDGTELLLARHR